MINNNFFSLFGLPIRFDIDKSALKQAFLHLQKKHHPDSTSDEKAEQNTALINHAFNTLNRDDLRAVYLLELQNIAFNADKSINDEPFLMSMMDYRMDLEDAVFDKNKSVIDLIAKNVLDLMTTTSQEFQIAFEKQDWQNSQIIAQKLKFLANLYDDVGNALANLQNSTDNDDDLYV